MLEGPVDTFVRSLVTMERRGSDVADDLGLAEVGEAAAAESEAAPATPQPDQLTEREERILAFERLWWRHAGSKEQAIRDTFGLSATHYYQLLNGLLDNPAALAYDPVLVGRLRRLRSNHARSRARD
jgi:hypothetical protein